MSAILFDLNRLIKDVCDNSSLTDADALTKEVLARIAEVDGRVALEQAMPVVVRRFLSRDHRPLAFPRTPSGDHGVGDTQCTTAAGGPTPFHSRKVHSIRTQWRNQLKARVNVGYKEWKFFGDCVRPEVDFLVAHRRELAASNIAAADYLETISQLMVKHGVEFVRELPEDVVNNLGGAA